MRSLGLVSPALIRFVCWLSGRMRAGFPVRSATWSSRRITATVCTRISHDRFHHQGEKLALKRHHYLFTHLLPYDYPDLFRSGGAGVAVLRTARAAADRPFRCSPDWLGRVPDSGWEEEQRMVRGIALKAHREPCSALIGRVSSGMMTNAPAQKREKIRLMRY